MVKVSTLKTPKVEKVSNGRSLLGAFDGEEIDGDDQVVFKPSVQDFGQSSKDLLDSSKPAVQNLGQFSRDIVDVSKPAVQDRTQSSKNIVDVSKPAVQNLGLSSRDIVDVSKPAEQDLGQSSRDILDKPSGQSSNDIVDVTKNIDPSEYDHLVARTFILAELVEPQERTFKTVAGVQIIKSVFNAVMIDPTGKRRVMTIWGTNAHNVYTFFE